MLLIGIMFENIPGLKVSLEGYSNYWETRVKAFGLATILLRAGLKINYTLDKHLGPSSSSGYSPYFLKASSTP